MGFIVESSKQKASVYQYKDEDIYSVRDLKLNRHFGLLHKNLTNHLGFTIRVEFTKLINLKLQNNIDGSQVMFSDPNSTVFEHYLEPNEEVFTML